MVVAPVAEDGFELALVADEGALAADEGALVADEGALVAEDFSMAFASVADECSLA